MRQWVTLVHLSLSCCSHMPSSILLAHTSREENTTASCHDKFPVRDFALLTVTWLILAEALMKKEWIEGCECVAHHCALSFSRAPKHCSTPNLNWSLATMQLHNICCWSWDHCSGIPGLLSHVFPTGSSCLRALPFLRSGCFISLKEAVWLCWTLPRERGSWGADRSLKWFGNWVSWYMAGCCNLPANKWPHPLEIPLLPVSFGLKLHVSRNRASATENYCSSIYFHVQHCMCAVVWALICKVFHILQLKL